jgi:hypothetical protein
MFDEYTPEASAPEVEPESVGDEFARSRERRRRGLPLEPAEPNEPRWRIVSDRPALRRRMAALAFRRVRYLLTPIPDDVPAACSPLGMEAPWT